MWSGWQKAERKKRHLNIRKQQYTVRYTYLLLENIRKSSFNSESETQTSEPEVSNQETIEVEQT